MKHARLSAIKRDVMDKLDYAEEPIALPSAQSVQEQREMVKLYKKKLMDTSSKHHILYEEDEYFAKSFYSFKDEGKISFPMHNIVLF